MIDGGALRTSRPAGRQAAHRGAPVRYQPEDSNYAEPMMQPEAHRQTVQNRQPEQVRAARSARNLGWVKWVVAVLLIALVGIAAWMFVPRGGGIAATIDSSKYQAVFLSNGQVYFGKLSIVSNDFMELTNVFYLERQLTASTGDNEEEEAGTPPVSSNENNFQLLKYSDVLYGSEDAMIISKDDIIRYENLRPDGVVAKAIANRR